MMDSARIQWALKYADNIQRQQLEELISRVNLVLDGIPPQQQCEQQIGNEALKVSSVESATKQIDNKIVCDCYWNTEGPQTETKSVNEFNCLQQQQQTGHESALAFGENNNKIVDDCFINTGRTDVLQPDHVVSKLFPTPIPNQQSEFAVPDNYELMSLDCALSSNATVNETLMEWDFRQNDNNKNFVDCSSNSECTEIASKAQKSSPLINYLYYLYERPLSPDPAVNAVNESLMEWDMRQNDNNKIVGDCCSNSGCTETGYPSLVESDIAQSHNKKIVDDCFSNSGFTETARKTHESDALLKQPDQVVSQLYQSPTAMTNQQREIAVSNECELRPLQCAISSIDDTDVQTKCPMKDINGDEGVTAEESLKELQLTQILHSNNYHDQNNFLYTKKVTRSLINSYFRCKNHVRHGCPATAVARNNDLANAMLYTKHNHKSNIKRLHNEKFDKVMDEVYKENEMETPFKVYLKTKQKLINEIDTANVPPPKSKESFVRRRKIKRVPTLPKTILDFIEIMSKAQYKHFTENEKNAKFYRGVWEDNGNSNIVFISQDALDMLNTMDNVTLLMDGTFKVLPRHFRRRFRQLYVISFIYKGRSYPLAYILMQTKDFKSYDLIFGRIKLLFPSVTVIGCMSDYEAGTRKALQKHFPDARISGCFFHYVQAMHKKFKKFGMSKDEKFKNALQEVSALALLPNNYILQGFEYINQKMKGLRSARWEKFSSYWKEQWPKAHISVCGLSDRTNNFSESLNNTINSLNGRRPTIWKLISNLKLIEMQRADELKNHAGGLIPKTHKTEEIRCLDSKIKEATEIFMKNRDIESFLKSVTFQDDFESYFKVRIFIFGVDEDGDDDDDCVESDDEVIPNWFNEQLNLNNVKRKIAAEDVNIGKKRRVALLI